MSILTGWNYYFRAQPAANVEQTAQRATLGQFQTYPGNPVEGRGTLTAQNGTPGKYWAITQPPQVFANHTAVVTSLLAGGTRTEGLFTQSLVDNNSMGF